MSYSQAASDQAAKQAAEATAGNNDIESITATVCRKGPKNSDQFPGAEEVVLPSEVDRDLVEFCMSGNGILHAVAIKIDHMNFMILRRDALDNMIRLSLLPTEIHRLVIECDPHDLVTQEATVSSPAKKRASRMDRPGTKVGARSWR